MSLLSRFLSPSSDDSTDESGGESVNDTCNHGHGEPDKTYYHEKKNIRQETWDFYARDTWKCDNCGAEITAKREIGTVEIDDDENLVIQ